MTTRSIKVLYDHIQRIRVVKNDTDSVCCELSVNACASFKEEIYLKISIKDENDPFFLLCTEINGSTYQKLKKIMGLLVDFAQFPDYLTQMLTKCADHMDRYTLVLEEKTSDPYNLVHGPCHLLKILETNEFQQLCLVALHLKPGGEVEVNRSIGENIARLKLHLAESRDRLATAEGRIVVLERAIMEKDARIRSLELSSDCEVKAVTDALQRDLLAEKRSTETLRMEYDRKVEDLRREWQGKCDEMSRKLQSELDSYKRETASLRRSEEGFCQTREELERKCSRLMQDVKMLQDEILRLESKTVKLETECQEGQNQVSTLKKRLSVLEREKEESEANVRKLTRLFETAEKDGIEWQARLTETTRDLKEERTRLTAITKDLSKANEIITKLNGELCKNKDKLNVRTHIALEQEKFLEKFKKEASVAKEGLISEREKKEQLNAELEKCKGALRLAEDTLKAKEEMVKKNEKIISWLNDLLGKRDSPQEQLQPTLSSRYAANTTPLTTLDAKPSVKTTTITESKSAGNDEKAGQKKTLLTKSSRRLIDKYYLPENTTSKNSPSNYFPK